MKIYKVICNLKDCANKGVIYYLRDVEGNVECGGCKTMIEVSPMSEKELAETFDYDLNNVNNRG